MDTIEKIVRKIIEDVRKEGDKALLKYTKRFDGISLSTPVLRIPPEVVRESVDKVSPQLLATLRKVKKNIELFQQRTLPRSWHLKRNGMVVGEKYIPLERVGLYIPGGKYPYPSTVLMTAVPAKVAGVKNVIMVTPPKNITNDVLAAAYVGEVDEVYQVGGAQAVAALALGTRSIPRVDKIFGPGNAYVTMAKKLLFGEVGIDSLAGPSEVIVVADDSAKTAYVIADLMAQAEHGSGSSAVLFTNSKRIFSNVKKKTGHIKNVRLKFYNDIAEIIKQVNQSAPEHVELIVKDPRHVSDLVKNAGAIFIGPYSPTALGDYWAGPSHVLPTGTTARFSSGLSSADFFKRSSVIEYTAKRLLHSAADIITLAEREGLKYHAASILQRIEKKK